MFSPSELMASIQSALRVRRRALPTAYYTHVRVDGKEGLLVEHGHALRI